MTHLGHHQECASSLTKLNQTRYYGSVQFRKLLSQNQSGLTQTSSFGLNRISAKTHFFYLNPYIILLLPLPSSFLSIQPLSFLSSTTVASLLLHHYFSTSVALYLRVFLFDPPPLLSPPPPPLFYRCFSLPSPYL